MSSPWVGTAVSSPSVGTAVSSPSVGTASCSPSVGTVSSPLVRTAVLLSPAFLYVISPIRIFTLSTSSSGPLKVRMHGNSRPP